MSVGPGPVLSRVVAGLAAMAGVSLTAGRGWALSLVPLVLAWAVAARRRAAAPEPMVPAQGPREVPEVFRQAILERDVGACRYCHREVHHEGDCTNVDKRGRPLGCGLDFEADHVVPYSKGGPTSLDNLVTACRRCNREKSDTPLLEWLASAWFTLAA